MADLRLVEESVLSQGIAAGYGYVLVVDSDHDSKTEVMFSTSFRNIDRVGLAFYERLSNDSFELVYSDTGSTGGHGITTGDMLPFAAGYLDTDSLTDLTGTNGDFQPDTVFLLVCQHEALSYQSYPESLVWYAPYETLAAQYERTFLTDLDQDGRSEILLKRRGVLVFENVADDSCCLVATLPNLLATGNFAVGDFDQDGWTDFASAGYTGLAYIYVWECTGDDSYELADSVPNPSYNGHDICAGQDVDQNGKPEFFVGYCLTQGSGWSMRLYQIEAVGNNSGHVPVLVEICCGSRLTLRDLSRPVNCSPADALQDRHQRPDVSVAVHPPEVLLGM